LDAHAVEADWQEDEVKEFQEEIAQLWLVARHLHKQEGITTRMMMMKMKMKMKKKVVVVVMMSLDLDHLKVG
jgi:hypothetical protein